MGSRSKARNITLLTKRHFIALLLCQGFLSQASQTHLCQNLRLCFDTMPPMPCSCQFHWMSLSWLGIWHHLGWQLFHLEWKVWHISCPQIQRCCNKAHLWLKTVWKLHTIEAWRNPGAKDGRPRTKAVCERLDAARLISNTSTLCTSYLRSLNPQFFRCPSQKSFKRTKLWAKVIARTASSELKFNIAVRFSESVFDPQSIAATSFPHTQAVTAASCSIGTCGPHSTSEASCKANNKSQTGACIRGYVQWSQENLCKSFRNTAM